MKSLAVKYRPQTLQEVCGNNVTIKILEQVIARGCPKHAYLFAGASGCGKTTLARILAKALNNNIGDPIELDAASHGNIDAIRAIVEDAKQRALVGTYKVFIIDECHAISSAGWQVFLKSLEDCPEYTIFMFCTTEPNKIPATILNRVQRFNISKIPTAEIKTRLEFICAQEGFTNYIDTCELISKVCNGGMREAITLLDQCADLNNDLSLENTKQVLGASPFERMMKLTNGLRFGETAFVFMAIETLANEGRDLKRFIDDYLSFVLELTKYTLFKDISVTNIPAYFENNSDWQLDIIQTTGFENAINWFNNLADRILEIKNNIKTDISPKSTIIAYLLKTCRGV